MVTEHQVLFSAEVIADTVRQLALSIDKDADGSSLLVVTVLKGAAIFSSDLVRAMRTDTELAYIAASSYIDGFTPGDSLNIQQKHAFDVESRDVLIVDDIVDTGRTLRELAAMIRDQGPRSVATAALINKTSRRSGGTEATYSGLGISDEFVYGYGLDWNERFRDLPFIAIANP
jgi:hypoxanthine phosphoribosyltransferase